jgi:septum formation protein
MDTAVPQGADPASPLILASASPRRRELLAACGLSFRVIPAAIDEHPYPNEPAEVYVRRLALAKAEAVAQGHPGAVVLGADTIVTIDRDLLGKPRDLDEARQMLSRLSGNVHEIVTGVAVLAVERAASASTRCASEVVTSRVLMRHVTEATIAWYLATGEPIDKAGAYAVQGMGGALVEWVEGSYTNVVGLPLTETLALLRRFGIPIPLP